MKTISELAALGKYEARLFGRCVVTEAGCWEYQRGRSAKGYGQITIRAHEWSTHRAAWMLVHGDPGEMHVLHKCDNPPCCNPEHLFLGTNGDNVRDSVAKGRRKMPAKHQKSRGNAHFRAKLTEADIPGIREMLSLGLSCREIGEFYGVSSPTIQAVKKRRTWVHVPDQST